MTNQAAQTMPETGSWFAADDVYRHARTIDVALNGEAGAASRPALCDVVSQIAALARQHGSLAAALAQTAGVAEPTLEMLNAGWRELERQGVDPESVEMRAVYDAMLAAAPAASGGESTVDVDDDAGYLDAVADVLESIGKVVMARVVRVIAAHIRDLAPNPPSSASVSERARAILSQAYRDAGFDKAAEWVFQVDLDNELYTLDRAVLRAIEQALTQQQAEVEQLRLDLGHTQSLLAMRNDEIEDLTQQRGEIVAWIGPRGDLIDNALFQARVSGLPDFGDLSEYRPLYTIPQPSADAVREDSDRLDWIESQISKYGDGYTEPREAGFIIEWQQERPDHRWPGLRAWIDEERRRTSADELESLLSGGSHA